MIIGCETLTWGVLLFLCVIDIPREKADAVFGNSFLWVPAFAFCYVLGIILDSRIHEVFFRSRQEAIRATVIRKREKNKKLSDAKCNELWREVRKAALAMPASAGGANSLDYIRHRIRIMRGSTGNIPLIAAFGALLLIKSEYPSAYPAVVLILGVLLACACYQVWKRIERSWSTLSYDWYVAYCTQQQQN
jgi:hypothetical protein